jgi:multiple sugar transport system substrate-binding protein
MPIPQYDPANPKMISQGPSVCVFNKTDPQEVLAAWLFTQYLLTNDVQIAYSETEGYVPVTTKAQNTAEYQDYLAAEGIDGNEHYSVKIKAAKLLLAHTGNTFTTPVFNGSASLRDAAGSLIESTAKSMRRKEKVDEKYFEKLFSDTSALYRLDQGKGNATAGGDLGPLPTGSKALLFGILLTWIILGTVQIRRSLRKAK